MRNDKHIPNLFLTFTLDSMTSFKNFILSGSPMHVCKLQKMHQTFQNPDPVQPDSQYLMEKAYTTARKGAIIHFFFQTMKRNLSIQGAGRSVTLGDIC